MTRRVVVTGLGPVTPIGVGADAFRAGQFSGSGGVRTITRFDPKGIPVTIAAEVDLPAELAMDRREAAGSDRCVQLALAAAHLALVDAGLVPGALDPTRVGVSMGTGMGGIGTSEQAIRTVVERGTRGVSPRFIPTAVPNGPAARIAMRYGFTGPCLTATTACAAGGDALVHAHQQIELDEADVMLAGGAEAPLIAAIVAGFANMRALSRRNDDPPRASRPFDTDRDGFVLAEGAAVLVLEEESHAARRGAVPLATFAGYGRTADAHHMTMPRPDAIPAGAAMRGALRRAGIQPEEVGHINAHGTATEYNDVAEARAIRAVFGSEGPVVTATKALTGHGLGAAAAIEAVAVVQALVSGTVPPIANLDRPAPGLDLRLADGGPSAAGSAALSNSFAFGGHNVVLAFTAASRS